VSAVAAEAANVFQVGFIFSSFFFRRPRRSACRDSSAHHCAEVHDRASRRRTTFDNDDHPHCSNVLISLRCVIILSLEATEISMLKSGRAVAGNACAKTFLGKIVALACRVPRKVQRTHSLHEIIALRTRPKSFRTCIAEEDGAIWRRQSWSGSTQAEGSIDSSSRSLEGRCGDPWWNVVAMKDSYPRSFRAWPGVARDGQPDFASINAIAARFRKNAWMTLNIGYMSFEVWRSNVIHVGSGRPVPGSEQ